MLTGPRLADPAAQVDGRTLRARRFNDDARALLEHVWVRKHAFYWRYDTGQELELLNRLWGLVSLRLNFFTPTKKAKEGDWLHHHRRGTQDADLRQTGHPMAAPADIRSA